MIRQVAALLSEGQPVIANVMHGEHFVLVVGIDPSTGRVYVNDPGFWSIAYEYADVVGWRLFNMTDVTRIDGERAVE